MSRLAIVELHKEEFAFSAGHFTIFSATSREDLHGHNYYVSAKLHVSIGDNGLSFDYRYYKKKILDLTQQLDRKFLLPAHSKFLKIENKEDMLLAHFSNEKIPFLNRDVVILPVTNITIEELSHWFLQKLVAEPKDIQQHGISQIEVSVYNGPGQSGTSWWSIDTSFNQTVENAAIVGCS